MHDKTLQTRLYFNVYTGRSADCMDYGLSHDVVMELIQPLVFQGYEVHLDNFYSSHELLTIFWSVA